LDRRKKRKEEAPPAQFYRRLKTGLTIESRSTPTKPLLKGYRVILMGVSRISTVKRNSDTDLRTQYSNDFTAEKTEKQGGRKLFPLGDGSSP